MVKKLVTVVLSLNTSFGTLSPKRSKISIATAWQFQLLTNNFLHSKQKSNSISSRWPDHVTILTWAVESFWHHALASCQSSLKSYTSITIHHQKNSRCRSSLDLSCFNFLSHILNRAIIREIAS